jgi:tRNA (cytidine32/uridine32-2'-O)-methyltransferase
MSTAMDRIRIVLVQTSLPANIGAVARAMRNMGLSRLVLVAPKQFPHPDATARASGADAILTEAQIVPSLEQAVAGCHRIYGTSARRRSLALPGGEPRDEARSLVRALDADTDLQAALVFGRERSGLTNEESARCQRLIEIPTAGDHFSLNLAMAVLVMGYELHLEQRDPAAIEADPERPDLGPPVPAEQMERFYAHLEGHLLASGFMDADNPRHLMRRLRRLFGRAAPDEREMSILRGVLTALTPVEKGSDLDHG